MLVLTFQIGSARLALDIRRVAEVVPRVRLRRVPGGPAWLAGLFVYRGRMTPVVDLHRLLGEGECPPLLSSRIILVPQPGAEDGRLLGLLAAQVADLREIGTPAAAGAGLAGPGQPDLGPLVVEGHDLLHLLEPERLLPEAFRRQLALVPREAPA